MRFERQFKGCRLIVRYRCDTGIDGDAISRVVRDASGKGLCGFGVDVGRKKQTRRMGMDWFFWANKGDTLESAKAAFLAVNEMKLPITILFLEY